MPDSVILGRALDLVVPLRLDPGESLSPACLQAEVSVGDRRLPRAAVQAELERTGHGPDGTRVRIRSTVVVQEPLVAVSLSVGCSGAVSRQFVVFANPAPTAADVPAVATAEALPWVAASASSVRAKVAPPPAARSAASRTQMARSPPRSSVAEVARAPAPRQGAATRTAVPVAQLAQAAARLKLDDPDELLNAATRAVAAQDAELARAVQAASATQAAATAAEARFLALGSSLQDIRAEAAGHGAVVEQLRSRLAQNEDQRQLMWALTALVVVLTCLALWLGMRLRALQRERHAGWWQAAAAPGVTRALDASSEVAAPARAQSQAMPLAPLSTARIADTQAAGPPPAYRTEVLPAASLVEESLTRMVSVDELMDLEQQADFFLVLGEEGAAIDLLMRHLRSTGGISPLPYLKLLEIYRRRADREAYERMCKRFDQRFNAVAPHWDADPEQGRDLQTYPQVLANLQAHWHVPLDAMAELENLLLRKRSGELFELPAYRDMLMLFSVARDLHRQLDHAGADVDVLLPLAQGRDMAATAVQPIFDRLQAGPDPVGAIVEDRNIAPIDLDLSQPAGAADSRPGELRPLTAVLRRVR
ncbi:MAG TPA: hypothetical protein VET87_15260 [Rubrivivax sp.]|nr:hypothetical protein [Rubrivivax sp.]